MTTCIDHLDESIRNQTDERAARRFYTAMTWLVELTDVRNPVTAGHQEGLS